MAMGRAEEALHHMEKAAEDESALREHNLAMAQALNGSGDLAKETLRRAWRMEEKSGEEEDVVCMLLLSRDHESVRSTKDVSLSAAVLTNMLTIGAEEASWCMERLSERYGEEGGRWLEDRP